MALKIRECLHIKVKWNIEVPPALACQACAKLEIDLDPDTHVGGVPYIYVSPWVGPTLLLEYTVIYKCGFFI